MAAIVLFCLALLVCIVLGTNILYALLAGLVIFTLYGKKQGFSWRELGKMICSGVKTSASVLLVFPLDRYSDGVLARVRHAAVHHLLRR